MNNQIPTNNSVLADEKKQKNDLYCDGCYRSLSELKQQKSYLLSHYVSPDQMGLICSVCSAGW